MKRYFTLRLVWLGNRNYLIFESVMQNRQSTVSALACSQQLKNEFRLVRHSLGVIHDEATVRQLFVSVESWPTDVGRRLTEGATTASISPEVCVTSVKMPIM